MILGLLMRAPRPYWVSPLIKTEEHFVWTSFAEPGANIYIIIFFWNYLGYLFFRRNLTIRRAIFGVSVFFAIQEFFMGLVHGQNFLSNYIFAVEVSLFYLFICITLDEPIANWSKRLAFVVREARVEKFSQFGIFLIFIIASNIYINCTTPIIV